MEKGVNWKQLLKTDYLGYLKELFHIEFYVFESHLYPDEFLDENCKLYVDYRLSGGEAFEPLTDYIVTCSVKKENEDW